jgi:hypothetical protein
MTTAQPTFQYVAHWQTDLPDENEAVLAFWRKEKAIADDASARKRLGEIVLHARTESGEVAGVCTAVPMTLPRLGQPMYYYRCFIGKDWRNTMLVLHLLNRAFAVLEGYARNHDYPCIGVVLELENSRFGENGRDPVWSRLDFVYIGISGRGLELRLRYFRGAKLKPQQKTG